jgi:nitroreductase
VATTPTNAVIDAMASARSMRYLKADPVDDGLVEMLLFAATRASNPGNSQPWDFVVVTSAELRSGIAGAVGRAIGERAGAPAEPPADPVDRRTLAGAHHLITHLAEAPVIILVCGRLVYPRQRPSRDWMLSACYAAAQNLVVAARSLGLGASFTTLQELAPTEVRALVGVPDDVEITCTMPVGWPAQPFGPVVRRPLEQVIHRNGW